MGLDQTAGGFQTTATVSVLEKEFTSLEFQYIENTSRPLSPFGVAVTALKTGRPQ